MKQNILLILISQERNTVLIPHYNSANSFSYDVKIYRLKLKDFETKPYPLGLRNIPKDFTINNMNKTGFYRDVQDLFVSYVTFDISDTVKTHKNLMNNSWIHKANVSYSSAGWCCLILVDHWPQIVYPWIISHIG